MKQSAAHQELLDAYEQMVGRYLAAMRKRDEAAPALLAEAEALLERALGLPRDMASGMHALNVFQRLLDAGMTREAERFHAESPRDNRILIDGLRDPTLSRGRSHNRPN